jgi:hypothetical protein
MKKFNSSDLIKKLEFYFDKSQNVLLTGHKGIGKTAIISTVFENKVPDKWLYFSGSTMDPWVDFIGVPKEKTNENGNSYLEFIRPSYMDESVEAIFVDEINRSAKKVKSALMELIQFKSINGKKFPNLKVVWAGANPYNPDDDENEIYDVEPLDPAQKDRFQIQIDLPNAIDELYFIQKYGEKWADGAIEWWNGLPEKTKKIVSPRRLDYALDIHKMGGDINDVLPHESSPSKLVSSIGLGGIQRTLISIFEKKDIDAAKNFVASENNFQSCIDVITEDMEKVDFFWPILDEERRLTLFFSSAKLQDMIFNNPIGFKTTLEVASKNKVCEKTLLIKIEKILSKMKGVSINDFFGTGTAKEEYNNSGGNMMDSLFKINIDNASIK